MKLKIVSFFLAGFFITSIKTATFENVTVLLTTELSKLFYQGLPPVRKIYIRASDTLDNYINYQPLEVVTIRNENIPQLTQNAVANLPSVVHISIISCGIKSIEPGTFGNVPKLDGLNLEGNLIQEIHNGVFTGLTIQTLLLNDNKITRIESGAFNNMTMSFISLSDNQISRWDSNWFVGTPVGSIYMDNNLLEALPANTFSYAFQFKKINVPLTIWYVAFTHNRIRTIHEEAFKHINAIGYLSLAGNQLEDLPKDVFHSVKHINTLDLRNNRIGSVDGVFDDININQLILINNTLSCFPREVFDVSKINYVFLDGNRLGCECVEMWKNLQHRERIQVIYNMKRLTDDCREK